MPRAAPGPCPGTGAGPARRDSPVLFGKGKETMRRVLLLVTGLGLLGASLGCHHNHGTCECELPAAGHTGPVPQHVDATVDPFGRDDTGLAYTTTPSPTYQ